MNHLMRVFAALDAAAEAPGGAGVPNRVFTLNDATREPRDRDMRVYVALDAAAQAPEGAGMPNRVFTPERRDSGSAESRYARLRG